MCVSMLPTYKLSLKLYSKTKMGEIASDHSVPPLLNVFDEGDLKRPQMEGCALKIFFACFA